jgi:preprotein translocase subunit Sec61beta
MPSIDPSLMIAIAALVVLALLAAWLLWETRRRNH